MSAKLKLIKDAPTIEWCLRNALSERKATATKLRGLDEEIANYGRALAKERGVAFIRVEQLQQEFGR